MEIICWMQTPPPVCQLPQGLVMLPPSRTHTHTLHPTTHNLWCRLFCFPRCLIFCTEHSFVSHAPVSLCFPPFCACSCAVIHADSLSDLAGILRASCVRCTLFQSATWRSLKWNWSGGSKNPLRWLYRFTSVANQLFYCNRGAALMRGGLFW